MNRPASAKPDAPGTPGLQLQVQYATPAAALPRWRLRRWVRRALDAGAADLARQGRPPSAAAFTLRLVDEDEGRALNQTWRQGARATNVLTFEYGRDTDGCASADIIICLPVLVREAQAQGKPLLHHAAHLVVHGVLHALGYDHIVPAEADHMESLETAVLARLGIADPYAGAMPASLDGAE